MTANTINALVRSILGELKKGDIKPLLMLKFITLGQYKVISDMRALGIKKFTKVADLSGRIANTPTDLDTEPESVIDVYTSTGVKRTMAIIPDDVTDYWDASSGVVNVEWNTPGTEYNAWIVAFVGGTVGQNPTVSVSGTTITITVETNVTLPASVVTALQNNPITADLLTASIGTATALQFGVAVTHLLIQVVAGSGAGFVPADELKIEDKKRVQENEFEVADAVLNPQYTIYSNKYGQNVIEFFPTTITYAYMIYYYIIAELTTFSDTITVPNKFIDLLVLDVLSRCNYSLRRKEEQAMNLVEYEKKKKELFESYTNTLQSKEADNTRIEANNTKN